VTFCKKIAKEDGVIDWSADSSAILNRFRAYHPWPGSFTGHADKRVVVTSLVDTKQEKHLAVGEFTFDKSERALLVGTADRCVAVRSLKPAGSKEMDAASFWNGLKDKSNNQFTNVSL
jgi:methionyl-tRNA formyltransferase